MTLATMLLAHLYNANGNLLWLIESGHFAENTIECYQDLARRLSHDADGLLLFNSLTYEAWILNRDGSRAQFCGNGLLSIGFHLHQSQDLKHANLTMSAKPVSVEMQGDQVSLSLEAPLSVIEEKEAGFFIRIPNPHCVFLEPSREWRLMQQGQAQCLKYDANIEWVWPCDGFFEVLVYERGVGPTQACGSGALAVFQVLQNLGLVDDIAILQMPGGRLTVRQLGSKLSLQGQVCLLKKQVV